MHPLDPEASFDPGAEVASAMAAPADPMLGRRVGHYRLLRRLGEGGMGAVYLAEREDEFRRRVAVKLIRYAMESPEVVGRFHTERQTLASLNHPNIVALIDGGATEEGLPYLVIEYVEGRAIDEYVTERNLPVAERLKLFLKVCAAVQYAHRSLVVHCDLKPTNILVAEDGEPKLLDFGIAKLLGARSQDSGYRTMEGRRPFTPKYASPEQLLGRPITTATDVYSLGVILFQILTAQSPYRFDTHSDAELVAAICVQEPRRPSAIAAAPQARRLEGDLDAIVLKALRKEPEARYSSVEHLAEDIRRHLDGRPVLARAGTLRYRAARFIARNRMAVAAAALALIAVLAGVIGVAWQARVALAARARAERRFNDVRKLAGFLLFDFHDAVQALPGSTPVQELLVKRSLQYLDGLAAEAAGDAGLQLELAEAYVKFGDVQGNPYNPNLGDTEGALASYRKALGLAEPLARSHPAHPGAVRALANVHEHTGSVLLLLRQAKEAAAHSRQAAALFENLAAAAPRDFTSRADLASSLEGLGDQLSRGLSDAPAALEAYRKSLAAWQAALEIDKGSARARRALATLNMKIADLGFAGDPRAALLIYQKAVETLEALPPAEQAAVPARRLAGILQRRVADSLWELKDTKGALNGYRKAGDLFTALAELDPANSRAQFDLVVVLNDAGQACESLGDAAGALRHYGRVADLLERLLKTDPANASWRAHLSEILVRIGGLLRKTGQAAEGGRQTARGLTSARQLGEKPDTPPGELVRAARLFTLCEPAELREPQTAVRYARRAVELTRAGDAYALDTLAEAQLQTGNLEAARAAIDQALALSPAPWLKRLLEAKRVRLEQPARRR